MFAYATILFSGLMASTVLASPLMSNSVCAKDNVVSCCNTSGGDGVLGNVLGGACDIHLLQSTHFEMRLLHAHPLSKIR